MKPDLTPDTNISELMDYAMTIQDQETADAFWKELIDWSLQNWNVKDMEANLENAEIVMRKNIGYWSGYYPLETAKRVKHLFKASHPILY